jgi:hypothetical protein
MRGSSAVRARAYYSPNLRPSFRPLRRVRLLPLLLLLLLARSAPPPAPLPSSLARELSRAPSVHALNRLFRRAALAAHPDRLEAAAAATAAATAATAAAAGAAATTDDDDAPRAATAVTAAAAAAAAAAAGPVSSGDFLALRGVYERRKALLEGRAAAGEGEEGAPSAAAAAAAAASAAADGERWAASACRAVPRVRDHVHAEPQAAFAVSQMLTAAAPALPLVAEVNLTLPLLVQGGALAFTVRALEPCAACAGRGIVHPRLDEGAPRCALCGGSGRRHRSAVTSAADYTLDYAAAAGDGAQRNGSRAGGAGSSAASSASFAAQDDSCLLCCGTGSASVAVCGACGGSGHVERSFRGRVLLPAGLLHEEKLPMPQVFRVDAEDAAALAAVPPARWRPQQLQAAVLAAALLPFRVAPAHPHLVRAVRLRLLRYCGLRTLRVRLPEGEGDAVVHFPEQKSCCSEPPPRITVEGKGLPVRVPGKAAGSAVLGGGEGGAPGAPPRGDLHIVLQLEFPDRVGAAEAEIFAACFGEAALPEVRAMARVVRALRGARVDIEEARERARERERGGVGVGVGGAGDDAEAQRWWYPTPRCVA